MDLAPPIIAAVIGAVVALLVTGLSARSEQRRWLRDKKLEAYVRFWDARRDMLNHLQEARDTREPQYDQLRIELRPTAIEFLASPQIGKDARQLYGTLMTAAMERVQLERSTNDYSRIDPGYKTMELALKEQLIRDITKKSCFRRLFKMQRSTSDANSPLRD